MASLFNRSMMVIHQRGGFIIRAIWVIIAGLSIGLIIAALIYRINRPWQFEESDYLAVARLGLTIPFYNAWFSAQELSLPIVWGLLGLSVFLLQPKDRGVLLFSIFLLTFPISGPPTFRALVRDNPGWHIPYEIISTTGLLASYLGFYLFPDGRFVPRWTRFMVPICIAWVLLEKPAKGLWNNTLVGSFGHLTLLLIGIAALTYRYRRASTPSQRQQIKWIVFALILAVIGQVINDLYFAFVIGDTGDWVFRMVAYNMFGLPLTVVGTQTFIALAMAFSILRYRLWDIDVVINRTLVYGVLTALIVGIYVLIGGGMGTLFQSQGNIAISLSAAGVVAVVFQPLRERLQRGVNRLMFGERDEPYLVLTRLGQQLEAAIEPAAALPLTVETVAHALKLPYVAVALNTKAKSKTSNFNAKSDAGDEIGSLGFEVVASYGAPKNTLITFPLIYAGETIGKLLAATRALNEPLSEADRRLLNDLAAQIGVAAHAALLSADLERARLRIVAAGEDARRRLGGDLHDGVGHQLAGLARKTESVANMLERDPNAARELLAEVIVQLNTAIAQVRGLAHQLHPPELELLGLAGALRERAQMQKGFLIRIDAPDILPPLPTAIETSAYYIALEALTNIEKHAKARLSQIRLALVDGNSPTLEMEITDDGRGLPPQPAHGLGLLSMQARAAEVGGVCRIESNLPNGTRVLVNLPVLKD